MPYEGEWKNGKRHGTGVFYWGVPDSKEVTVYVGEWENNRRKGYGCCYWQTGDKYEGEWKDDKSNGKGKYYLIHLFIYFSLYYYFFWFYLSLNCFSSFSLFPLDSFFFYCDLLFSLV